MSQEIVILNEITVNAVFYKSQPVLTFGMIDTLHQRPEGTSRVTFNRNKKRFIPDEDYFVCDVYEAKTLGFTAPNGLIFLAESGYLMLVKPFTDDRSWQIQRQLVKLYFRVKAVAEAPKPGIPDAQWREVLDLTRAIARCCHFEERANSGVHERLRWLGGVPVSRLLAPEQFEDAKIELTALSELAEQHFNRMIALDEEFINAVIRPPVSIRKVRALVRRQALQPSLNV